MDEQVRQRELPRTDSIEELARFWDSHDLTDFEDQLEEVPATVFDRTPIVHVPLRPEEYSALQRIAEARGVAKAELIHEWVAERMHAEESGEQSDVSHNKPMQPTGSAGG